jgi:hypothetical protein
MTTHPAWSPVDDETEDLLALVAEGTMATDTAEQEWHEFVTALRFAADDYGVVRPNVLRPLIRGVVAPRRIGAFVNRALSQGLVAYTGEWEVSTDTAGRNSGKPCRVMRLCASDTS